MTQCLPKLHGQLQRPEDFLGEVLDGFRLMYRALLKDRAALLSSGGLLENFVRVETRCLLRPTQEYFYLLFWSLAPDHLTSGASHDLAFEMLCGRPLPRGLDFAIIEREKRQLWRRDIPYFHGRPGVCNMMDVDGTELGPAFPKTSHELMGQRLCAASEDDLAWQLEVVRASLTMAFVKTPPLASGAGESQVEDVAAMDGSFLPQACEFGEALERLALHSAEGVTWLSLAPEAASPSLITYRLGCGLYAGTAGVALFLANLARIVNAPALALLRGKPCALPRD